MKKRPPISEWNSIQAKVDQVLGEEFWQDIAEMIPVMGPRIDVYETDREVVVVVELPGLKSTEDVKITINGSFLSINGKIESDYPVAENGLLQSERFFGSFNRNITLPNLIYQEIKAKFHNGLLNICLTKTNIVQEKEINIEHEES